MPQDPIRPLSLEIVADSLRSIQNRLEQARRGLADSPAVDLLERATTDVRVVIEALESSGAIAAAREFVPRPGPVLIATLCDA